MVDVGDRQANGQEEVDAGEEAGRLIWDKFGNRGRAMPPSLNLFIRTPHVLWITSPGQAPDMIKLHTDQRQRSRTGVIHNI